MRRTILNALATVALGALLGYVVTGFGGPMVQQIPLFGAREASEAHRYILGIVQNEPETLAVLSPKADLVSRAMQLQQSKAAQGQWKPLSLTYLGGRTVGGLGIHMYAIEIRGAQGQEQFVPFALTLANGKIIRRE